MGKNIPTKRELNLVKDGSTVFLRLVVLAIAAVVWGLYVFALPAGIATDTTGLYRWVLLGLYVPAIPFFCAIYQTMKLLRYIDENNAFSDASVAALRIIKSCGVIIAGTFIAGMPYVYYAANQDDAPGVVAIGLVIIGASVAVSVFAAVLERLLRSAIALKKENDLTV